MSLPRRRSRHGVRKLSCRETWPDGTVMSMKPPPSRSCGPNRPHAPVERRQDDRPISVGEMRLPGRLDLNRLGGQGSPPTVRRVLPRCARALCPYHPEGSLARCQERISLRIRRSTGAVGLRIDTYDHNSEHEGAENVQYPDAPSASELGSPETLGATASTSMSTNGTRPPINASRRCQPSDEASTRSAPQATLLPPGPRRACPRHQMAV